MAFVKGTDTGQVQGIQRSKIPVVDCDSGTGNKTINLAEYARELVVSNDSTLLGMTFKVTGPTGDFTFVLGVAEVFDERFPPFNKIEITATGAWRCYWRSGVIV